MGNVNPVPQVLTAFAVFLDGKTVLGVADVELPDIEYMTETVAGAGIAGEVDAPVVGMFKATALTVNFRTITENLAVLSSSGPHHLDFRGSIQNLDAAKGAYVHKALKVVVTALPKKGGLGKLETGKQQGNGLEFEVPYLKADLEGKTVIEIDKFNYVCNIAGIDALSKVRENLGI